MSSDQDNDPNDRTQPYRPWRNEDDVRENRPRRPRRRRDDPSDERSASQIPGGSSGMAIAGLLLGLMSLCTGLITGIPAIICSVVALKKPGGKGLATAGLILGTIGTVVVSLVLMGLLIPAIEKIRLKAAENTESHNLKQIGLSLHAHHDLKDAFPPATGDLSWRVHILPFMDQDTLYRGFDQTQPWDSPTNRSFSSAIVKTYQSPLDAPDSIETHYRVFVGPGTIYEPGEPPMRLTGFRDGASNTLFAIEAAETVPWAQPKELPFTPKGPLPALGHPERGVVLILMADGSVRSRDKATISPTVFRAMITPAGGEMFKE